MAGLSAGVLALVDRVAVYGAVAGYTCVVDLFVIICL